MLPDAPEVLLHHKIQKCWLHADMEPEFSLWFSVLLCEAAINWEASTPQQQHLLDLSHKMSSEPSFSAFLKSNVLWYWLQMKSGRVWAYLLPAESYWWKGGFPTPPFYFILEQPFD